VFTNLSGLFQHVELDRCDIGEVNDGFEIDDWTGKVYDLVSDFFLTLYHGSRAFHCVLLKSRSTIVIVWKFMSTWYLGNPLFNSGAGGEDCQ
jgi:hypothetical protein